MSLPAGLALAALALWLLAACAIPRLRLAHRGVAVWVLVLAGVPLLGWLTLRWGPGLGVLGFALGLLVLYRPPLRRRRSARVNRQSPEA
ncbi:MAG: DUF2484 family protein [Paracoccus sp. (in: a-proteobacteria)]|uniref:DUF2484 family protein n=1 Tax=Paracoccus sp. TaxID=267 RepID=UPI00391992C2